MLTSSRTERLCSSASRAAAGEIWLDINGERRQQGDLAQQIWTVPEALAYLSTFVTLLPGDLLMTGTPSGVGAVEPGDRLTGHIDGIGDLEVGYRLA